MLTCSRSAEGSADPEMPIVLEALPADGIPTMEPASPDVPVFTVPGLAMSMPTALGCGRYLPIFLSERQRDAALVRRTMRSCRHLVHAFLLLW